MLLNLICVKCLPLFYMHIMTFQHLLICFLHLSTAPSCISYQNFPIFLASLVLFNECYERLYCFTVSKQAYPIWRESSLYILDYVSTHKSYLKQKKCTSIPLGQFTCYKNHSVQERLQFSFKQSTSLYPVIFAKFLSHTVQKT